VRDGYGYRTGQVIQARSDAHRREWEAAMAESNKRLRQKRLVEQAAQDYHHIRKQHNRWEARHFWWRNNGVWVAWMTVLVGLASVVVLAIRLL
jgi:hypothetical protein